MSKYKYMATKPMLPPAAVRKYKDTPIMDNQDMEYWLNSMDDQGWEFVSYAAKHWHDIGLQDWWIFKRLRKEE